MDNYIKICYLIPLLLSTIVTEWILYVKKEAKLRGDLAMIHGMPIYCILQILPIIAIFISLTINCIYYGLISTSCYITLIIIVRLINFFWVYPIYSGIVGKWKNLVPIAAIIPLLFYLFIIQIFIIKCY